MVHLGPPKIELREIHPGQIGRSEIRAAALAPLRFNVQPMCREDLPDLSGGSTRWGPRAAKSIFPAKGDWGLSDSAMKRCYS
jgi:hypothetical protein